tara:strand:+ start:190 stop:492 length:303 start_codon:yes stop_codon:yes gene_type:complete
MKVTDNPDLHANVEADSVLKSWLVNYVGDQQKPEDGDVTVEMIVKTIAQEFPEFLLAVAEENWIRGYHQAMIDVEQLERRNLTGDENNEDTETSTVEQNG